MLTWLLLTVSGDATVLICSSIAGFNRQWGLEGGEVRLFVAGMGGEAIALRCFDAKERKKPGCSKGLNPWLPGLGVVYWGDCL
jgi:hypothetical protein